MSIIGFNQKVRRVNLSSVEDIDSSGTVYCARFHPDTDGFIAAVGAMTNKQLIVYSWNGTDTLAEVETVNTGHNSYGVDWHPDGDFLANTESGDTVNSVTVYSWNGSDTLAEVETAGITNGAQNLHWHPSGDFLAVGSYDPAKGIIVYSWNGSNTLAEVETVNTGFAEYTVRWSHDGNYLAVSGTQTDNEFKVYSWNGSDTLTEKDTYDLNGSSFDNRWSSDGAYIFCGAQAAADHQIYVFSFDGNTLALEDSVDLAGAAYVYGIDLFNDRYLAAGIVYGSTLSQEILSIYKFDPGTETVSYVDGFTTTARGVFRCKFDSKGLYIAAPMYLETNISLRMLKMYTLGIPSSAWTQGTSSFGSKDIFGVAYDGTTNWVMVGDADVPNSIYGIATSTDTTTWTQRSNGYGAFKDVSYGGGYWVSVTYNGKILTATQADPTSWTSRASGFGTHAIYGVAYDGSTDWTAVGAGGAGIESVSSIVDPTAAWNQITNNGSTFYSVAYGNSLWVAVGISGQLYSASDPTGTWTSRTSSFGSEDIYDVYYDNSLWVAVGESGKIATSTDAITWTQRTSSFDTTNVNGIFYGNSLWVAVGDSGKIATSADAITWTQRLSSFGTYNINAVFYGDSLWVAVGDSGKIATTADPTA